VRFDFEHLFPVQDLHSAGDVVLSGLLAKIRRGKSFEGQLLKATDWPSSR
jgi:fructose-1-phosphate kinase PfkB-like protein